MKTPKSILKNITSSEEVKRKKMFVLLLGKINIEKTQSLVKATTIHK